MESTNKVGIPEKKRGKQRIPGAVFLAACGVFLLLARGPLWGKDINGFLLLGLVGVLLWFLSVRTGDRRFVWIVAAAFLLRAFLAIVSTYLYPLPDSTADALTFQWEGWQLATAWQEGEWMTPGYGGGYFSYIMVVAFVYFLTGQVPLAIQGLSVFLGCLLLFPIYWLTRDIFADRRVALAATTAAVVFPTGILYSALILRENFMIVPFAFSFLFLLRFLQEPRVHWVLGSFVLLLLASLFHESMLFIIPVYLAAFFFQRKRSFPMFITPIILTAVTVVIFILFPEFNQKIPSQLSSYFDPDRWTRILGILSASRTGYLTGFYPSSLLDFFWQTPIRSVYFLFSPFPWTVREWLDFPALIDSLLYVFLALGSVAGMLKIWKDRKSTVIVTVAVIVVLLILFAWGTSNYGTAIRHRHKFAWLFLVLSAPTLGYICEKGRSVFKLRKNEEGI